jgi:hypothetical protein
MGTQKEIMAVQKEIMTYQKSLNVKKMAVCLSKLLPVAQEQKNTPGIIPGYLVVSSH